MTTTAPPPPRPRAAQPRAFPVHPVAPAEEPAETGRPLDVLGSRDDAPRPTACSRLAAPLVADRHPHALVGAVHRAFAEHRPLVLSPDMIWTAVVQGVARHVRNHAEGMRSLFVSHEGRKTLSVEAFSDAPASPEFPWAETVDGFAAQVVREVGGAAAALRVDFSTTGPTERIARDVAVLDAFEPYFTYNVGCVCGIPAITLEGTPADWDRLRAALDGLGAFGMDWWIVRLRKIADRFAAASRGEVNTLWWRAIYKRKEVYGGSTFSGWFAWLFPYVGPAGEVRNPVLDDTTGAAQIGSGAMPPGPSEVPVTVVRQDGGREPFDLLGGFVGIEPAGGDGCGLRPVLGWAVRRPTKITAFRREAREFAAGPPIDPARRTERLEALRRLADFTLADAARKNPHTRRNVWEKEDGPGWVHDVLDLGDGVCWPATPERPAVRIDPLARWTCVLDRRTALAERPDWYDDALTHTQALWIRFGSWGDKAALVGSPRRGGPLGLLDPSGEIREVAPAVLDGLRKLLRSPPHGVEGPAQWMRHRRRD